MKFLAFFSLLTTLCIQSAYCGFGLIDMQFVQDSAESVDQTEALKEFNFRFKTFQQKKDILLAYSNWMVTDPDLIHGDLRGMNTRYLNFFRFIQSVLPESGICDYFYGCEKPVFSLQAMKLLVGYYAKNSEYSDHFSQVSVMVIDEFEMMLGEWSQSGVPFGKQVYLVRSAQKHFTPIFIENTPSDGVRVVISNSTGIVKTFVDELHRLFRSNLPGIKIHIFAPCRQWDGTSCPMMSLDDIFSHFQKDLFDFVRTEARSVVELPTSDKRLAESIAKFPGDENTLLLAEFPKGFMRVAQNPELIQEYLGGMDPSFISTA